jgi:hypothetical protein
MPNTRSSGVRSGRRYGSPGSAPSSHAGGRGFADGREGRSTDGTNGSTRPRNIETHVPAHIRRVLREGTHYLYLHGQLCEIESGLASDNVTYVDDGDIVMVTPRSAQTPGTSVEDRKIINGAAAKAWGRRGKAAAWETLLRPLTHKNPLPVEVSDYLFKHFSASHKPSKLLFNGIHMEDHERHRNSTSCFVCAALCDQIIRNSADQSTRVLRSQTSAARYSPVISDERMASFLHASPVLHQFLSFVNTACYNRDSDSLRQILIIPDPAAGDVEKNFLNSLQKELKLACPKDSENNEKLLMTALNNVSTAGWVSAQPVVLDYLKLIRDWTWPSAGEQEAQLRRLIDDVSEQHTNFCMLMNLDKTMHSWESDESRR